MAHTCRICSPYVPGLTHADTAREGPSPVSTLESPMAWRLYRERVAYWRN